MFWVFHDTSECSFLLRSKNNLRKRRVKQFIFVISKSSHRGFYFYVHKNFAIFTGKQLYRRLFLIKLQSLQACNFLKKRLQHRCFRMSITRFLRTLILKNICEQLLLNIILFHLCVSWLRSINACSVHLHPSVNSV